MKRVGSLFAGIGGIDLGFEQAGFKVAWANERDKDACKTYRANFPNTLLIESDIKEVNFSTLEKVDILTAGFPCQPFSVCGAKKGFTDARGNLFFEIMRAADELQPPVIFLENVANLTEHDNGRTFNIIHNELVSRGYIIRYIIADACDFGMPQHRTRIYIVAFKSNEDSNRFSFPEKTGYGQRVFDVIDRSHKSDDKYYLSKDDSRWKQLDRAISDFEQIYRFSDYGIQKSKDGISFTLKANMGTWYNRVPYICDDYGIRTISPKECLLLQGFPETFSFPDDIEEQNAYKQSGNTVCVPVVALIAKKIQQIMP